MPEAGSQLDFCLSASVILFCRLQEKVQVCVAAAHVPCSQTLWNGALLESVFLSCWVILCSPL